jgi:hypothetical protein
MSVARRGETCNAADVHMTTAIEADHGGGRE